MEKLLNHIAQSLQAIDAQDPQHRNFLPGIGPIGEPQLVRRIRDYFIENFNDIYPNAQTHRTPDFLIPEMWAIEFKIVRPFGNNGGHAENWSENLIHPFRGNQSSIGDIYRLQDFNMNIRKGIIVITYEHNEPRIDLSPLFESFDLITRQVCHFNLSNRHQVTIENLIHPVHQRAIIYGWEIL